MQIDFQGKSYTVGNKYTIYLNNYRLKQSHDEPTEHGVTKVKAKLVFGVYMDGEMYGDDYHYGLRFEYDRVWNGVSRKEHITFPDALGYES